MLPALRQQAEMGQMGKKSKGSLGTQDGVGGGSVCCEKAQLQNMVLDCGVGRDGELKACP